MARSGLTFSYRQYRLVGIVLAWSLEHGGPTGNNYFFSPILYNSIAYRPGVKPPCIEDIPDSALKRKIIINLFIYTDIIVLVRGCSVSVAVEDYSYLRGLFPVSINCLLASVLPLVKFGENCL